MKLAPSTSGLSRRFLALLEQEGLGGKRVLDLGCGWGRLALVLAVSAARVVGLDRDAGAIRNARERAAGAGLGNVEFHEMDVEREDYGRFAPDLITAHLCASDAIMERAGRALPPGGCLGMVAFHVDQWRETGRVSRFAYDEARMEAVLRRAGLEGARARARHRPRQSHRESAPWASRKRGLGREARCPRLIRGRRRRP